MWRRANVLWSMTTVTMVGGPRKSKRSEYTFWNNRWVFVCLFVCVLQLYPVCLERLEDAVTIHEPLFVCLCSSTLSWFVWSVHKSLLVCLFVCFLQPHIVWFGKTRRQGRAHMARATHRKHAATTCCLQVASDASYLLGNCAGLLINCLLGTQGC